MRMNRLCAFLFLSMIAMVGGCAGSARSTGGESGLVFYPPRPSSTRIIALGLIRCGFAGAEDLQYSALRRFVTGEEAGEPGVGLIRPLSVAVRAGELLVCDVGLGAVVRIDLGSGLIKPLIRGERHQPSKPVAVAVGVNGDAFVADRAGGVVLRVDGAGAIRQRYRLEGEGREFKPIGLAVGRERLYVVDSASHSVEIFDLQSSRHLGQLGADASVEQRVLWPVDVAADSAGRVYVLDMGRCRLQIYDAGGELVGAIGECGDRPGHFARARSVAVGPDGIIYVSDVATQIVQMFSAEGELLMYFGGPSSDPGGMTLPTGVSIAGSVVDHFADRLPKGFGCDYIIFVANQLGPSSVGVYAFGKFGDDDK